MNYNCATFNEEVDLVITVFKDALIRVERVIADESCSGRESCE